MDCPGVAGTEKPYDPFFVLVMHDAVDVGIAVDVVMHASVTPAPDPSLTMPVKVMVGLAVGVGVGVCGGSLRVAVARDGAGGLTPGTPETGRDAGGDGEVVGDGDALAAGSGVGGGTRISTSIFRTLPSSS